MMSSDSNIGTPSTIRHGHLALASDADEVVFHARLEGVAHGHGDILLLHEGEYLVAEGAGGLVVENHVVEVHEASFPQDKNFSFLVTKSSFGFQIMIIASPSARNRARN